MKCQGAISSVYARAWKGKGCYIVNTIHARRSRVALFLVNWVPYTVITGIFQNLFLWKWDVRWIAYIHLGWANTIAPDAISGLIMLERFLSQDEQIFNAGLAG